jgi:hypothetical protein
MLTSLLCGVAAAAVVWLLHVRVAGSPAKRGKGVRELTFPLSLRIIVLVLFAFSFFIVYAASKANPDQATMARIVASCFVGGSLYLVWSVFMTRVWWTTEGIGSGHLFGRDRFLRWDDVEAGGYATWGQAFYVKGAGTRIWYSPMHAGIVTLHRYMAKRLKPIDIAHLKTDEGPDRTDEGR